MELSKLYNSKIIIWTLLVLFLLPNILLAFRLELAFDETYYWIYSQFLDFGYYDHPPMVGVFIALGEFLFGHNELGVRVFSLFSLIGTMYILWNTGDEKKNALIFMALLFSVPLVNLTGMFALPDAPLMLFTALFFRQVGIYLKKDSLKNALGLAFVIAAMFYSKYHGLLIVLLTVAAHPKFLQRKSFWLIVFTVVVLFMPHMYWQYTHDFITFKFHLFKRGEKHFNISNILDYVGGQVFLMGFLNFFLFTYIFYKNKFKDPFERILMFNSFGFLIFLLVVSLRNQIEANWTISCSLALVLLMQKYVKQYAKPFFIFSAISIVISLGLRGALLNAKQLAKLDIKDNRLNEVTGWVDRRIPKIRELCTGKRIVGDNYQVTSKLAFYTNNSYIPAIHVGSRDSQYGILNLQRNIPKDEEICYLTSKKVGESVIIETNFKDPVHVVPSITLDAIAKRFNTTYEEIIRN